MQTAIILGAGIMGLSAARALAASGWSVTVLDQDALPNARGSSVDEHRLIRHAYGAEAGYMRMVDAAYAVWDQLWSELGERLYVPTGVLALGDFDRGWIAESRRVLRAAGHAVEDLPAAAVAARFPMLRAEGIGTALHMRQGGVLLARRIVAGLLELVRSRGVTLRQARVVEVDPARASVALEEGGRLSADLLVLAGGPWAPRLVPGLDARVVPSRQIVVYLQPPATQLAAWQAAPMVLDLAEDGGFYAVPPVAGTGLKIGDHRFSRRGDAYDPREASAAEVEEILSLARPRLREAAGYRITSAKACYYDVEPEERFVLERLAPGCFVMSGFSGHGFKFGPLLGERIAAAANNRITDEALRSWGAGKE